MQLFYSAIIDSASENFIFDKEESKHIIKVLRKKENDILHVTNGLGFIFETKITLASESKCTVKIISSQKAIEPKYHLHLAVAPTKMNDRYEWFLEKATEIGISEITPIICDRSERKNIKTDRFDKIILSAMKQSNQLYLPKLNLPITYSEFISKSFEGQKFVAHCEEISKKSLQSELKSKGNYTILIGPEGDFSEKEIQLALQNKFIPISLGNTRLRTETAAIVACHSVAFINEN
jgi:16S rRNA (uracil1498-N3)-methyltransferase